MWEILPGGQSEIMLPKHFNASTMLPFIHKAVTEQCDARCEKITFNFSELEFIEPVGVVVLSNLVEYFLKLGVRTHFAGTYPFSVGTVYMDDAGFFQRYLGNPLRGHARCKETTLPLRLLANPEAVGYLYGQMIPWMAQRLQTTENSLATVRVCMQEIFHNISDHSGVQVGCVFAQHFPKISEIHIAVSDFGLGIPESVRRVRPGLSDSQALALAIQEGFTSQSNVRNRGAGLAILMQYVTMRNGGLVFIDSAKANVSALQRMGEMKVTVRERQFTYPGTLVRVVLKTQALRDLAQDTEQEEFSW